MLSMLMIRSESYFVDDVMWGASPATIPGLSAGTHTLRLELAGYRNLTVPVTVSEGKTAGYALVLVPESPGKKSAAPLSGVTMVLALAGAGVLLYARTKSP